MKWIDAFLLRDILKLANKSKIGYYIDDIQPYNKALASTRMRCYDIIDFFEEKGISAELYKPFRKYDVVFFIKTATERAVRIARKLEKEGVYLILDSYSEFLDDPLKKDFSDRINIIELLSLMDVVNVCSDVQVQTYSKYHDNVRFVGDSVHEKMFLNKKEHSEKEVITLIYCGYGKKVSDTLVIAEVIKRLQKEFGCRMIFLSNEKPEIKEFEWDYMKYNQNIIGEQLCKGDIMIAPRPMTGIEKLPHSNTKIAYPMSLGLPVVASPISSYLDSPAIICRNNEEWYENIKNLILNVDLRKEVGEKSRLYIKENYSRNVIGEKYLAEIKERIS